MHEDVDIAKPAIMRKSPPRCQRRQLSENISALHSYVRSAGKLKRLARTNEGGLAYIGKQISSRRELLDDVAR
jgi:hypothetical protein